MPRLPPIQGLLAFEALARRRNVTQVAEELHVTPSAVSHRIRQLETQLGFKLFGRSGFVLTSEGDAYLGRVREALSLLQGEPDADGRGEATRLRVAVTPTFSRQILLPRLSLFRHRYPEINLVLQVALPALNAPVDGADLELRFGTGPFADRESVLLLRDEVTPACSPEYLHEAGPFDGFDTDAVIARARLIRCPLEPWRTWFQACGLTLREPAEGDQFDDIGLTLDAAVAGFGVALLRLKLGAAWLDSGRLVRLSPRAVPSPHHYHLCWKPGKLQRWECAAFVDWLQQSLR